MRPDPRVIPSVWSATLPQSGRVRITKVLDSIYTWAVGKEGIYFFTWPDKQGHSDLCLQEFATGKIRKILTIERLVSWSIAVTPDGRTLLYSQFDETGSDLMLVENFR